MKKIYLFLPALLWVVLFTSCEKTTLRSTLEEVPECLDLEMTRDNVIKRHEGELGTIREITLFAPSEEPTAADSYELWVIMPDANPDLMFEPCNLPEAQMIPNRRVSFSGHSLLENRNTSGLEGVTPFNLTEITDGVEGPSENDDC